MAARDRFGAFAEPAQSPLQRYIRGFIALPVTVGASAVLTCLIDNACDPQNYEPNLALNLEVADLINSKKGNA